ncbi:MAG: SpoIIE family protein phosphatase [Candidatus Cloacimonetes bacterium]|nr:SpoIIE family protein phosphatase [Candidatus Cloacimonadota bacterium]
MDSLVKDPIKRKIFILVILFIIVAISIFGSKIFMDKVIAYYINKTINTNSLLDLNQVVYRHIMLIQRNFDLLISANYNLEDISKHKNDIKKSFNDIRIILNNIKYGGSFDYNYFDDFSIYSSGTKIIHFTPVKNLNTDEYVNTFTASLIRLNEICDELNRALTSKEQKISDKVLQDFAVEVESIIQSSNIVILKFHKAVMTYQYNISREKMAQLDKYNLIRYVGLLVIGLISLIIFITTFIQISNIIEEKNKTMLDLDKVNRSLLKELEVAENVQAYLKPQWLVLDENLIFSATYTPSKKIGGDFSDTITISKGKYVTYVGDISSHGVQAALIMSAVKATINMVIESEKDNLQPHYIIRRISNIISKELFPNNYLTLLICLIDIDLKTVTYYNAGQPPIIVLNKKSRETSVVYEKSSVPIGWRSDYQYSEEEENTINLDDDTIIFLFSDGIYQCRNRDNEQLSLEQFADFISENFDEDRQVILSHMLKSSLIEKGYTINSDDFTLVSFWNREMEDPSVSQLTLMRSLLTNTKDIGAFSEQFVLTNQDGNFELAMQVELIVNEFLNNIIVHGLRSKSDTVILFKMELADELILSFWDKGITWDIPNKLPGQDPFANKNDLDTSGRGIPIIYSLTSKVFRKRLDEVNETVMYIPLTGNMEQFYD